jgi:hypothetical protein
MHRLLVFGSALLAVGFIVGVGAMLPEVVASNFGVSGKPNAFMPRTPFVALMSLLAGGLPPLIWWLQVRLACNSTAKISNPSFWFAPQRREATTQWLSRHAAVVSVATSVFFSYVFWLVYIANGPGAALPTTPFVFGLVAYLLFTAGWVLALKFRFRGRIGA